MQTSPHWREEYALCEHVASVTNEEADKMETRHAGFRVCCNACWDKGFLRRDDLEGADSINGLTVRSFPKAEAFNRESAIERAKGRQE